MTWRQCRRPMFPRFGSTILSVVLVAMCTSAFIALPAHSAASSAMVTTETRLGPDGAALARHVTLAEGLPLLPVPSAETVTWGRGTYLWVDTNHGAAIADDVAITGDGSWGVAGWWLNSMRFAAYTVAGDATPDWVQPMPLAEFQITVDADHSAQKLVTTARRESLLVFTSSGPPPDHMHGYTPPLVGYRCAVSNSGNTYAGGGGNPAGGAGEIRVHDVSGTRRFTEPFPAPPEGVAVSADGLVVSGNVRGFVKIWDAMTGALRDSVPIPGDAQLGAVLSGDGSYLVTGGFSRTVRLYAWDGVRYNQVWAYTVAGTTWISALAISEDGSTVAAGTWTNPTGGKVVVFSTASATPLWIDDSYGDWVSGLSLTPDGGRLVAGSWGRQGATVGNIISVYERNSATPIHAIVDDQVPGVGSCMSVDISADGRYVLAGGKAVHAREFGNGGWVMAIELPTADVGNGLALSSALRAMPNPFSESTRILASAPAVGGLYPLRVLGADGRIVRSLPAGTDGWIWDGRDHAGREAPAGIYLVTGPGGEVVRVTRVR